ncbi:MAG: hypothetical protein UHM08_09305 [Bacteroidales bacterium]|nr:hypothetical protein [Bacteroidales bacterium]
MMLKCPVCNAKLKEDGDLLYCPNDHCGWVGNEAFWEDFIYVTKKLDRAKWWLKEIVENHRYTPISTAEMALKELEE